MKDEHFSTLRNILRKIVFPLRKRKQAFYSKLRLSIILRISYEFSKLLLIHGLILFIISGFLFLLMFEKDYENKIGEITNKIEADNSIIDVSKHSQAILENTGIDLSDNPTYDDFVQYTTFISINPYFDNNINLTILDNNNNIIYDDSTKHYYENTNLLDIIYYNHKDSEYIYIVQRNMVIDNENCTLYFQMNFSQEFGAFKGMTGFLLIILVILTLILAFGASNVIEPIFQPIKDMSDAANKLTINNLNSQRLNADGTKNELKDLATTFNNMLDRLEVSYESQKQFVSDASHELRTPIAVIQGYINLLDRWGKSDEAILNEGIDAIKKEAFFMQDMVEKLLFLSRNDKKTLKLEKKRFNAKNIVTELIHDTTMVAPTRNIGTRYIEDTIMYADKQSIKQLLRILVDNAVKYSDDGDSIFISCRTTENGMCELVVEDTGFGMTRSDAEKMFERFYRSDDVRGKKITGNGLGLSLAKLIVLKHVGTIKVTTQFSKGTIFTMTFPSSPFL